MKILMALALLFSMVFALSRNTTSALPVSSPTPPQATEDPFSKTLADYVTDEELTAYFDQFGDCNLPCLWGIRIGQTRNAEIRRLLMPLYVPVEVWTHPDGSRILGFATIDVRLTTRVDTTRPQSEIPDSLTLSVYNVSADSVWQRFNVQSVLKELGTPQEIYVHPVGNLDPLAPWYVMVDLYYPNILLVAHFEFTIQQGEEVCLAQTPISMFKLWVHDPTVPLKPNELIISWGVQEDRRVGNTLHMTAEEFAATVLAADQCIKVS